MRKSPLSLYGPFLVIALVQALVIAVAPSKSPTQPEIAALPADQGGAPAVPGAPDAPGIETPTPGSDSALTTTATGTTTGTGAGPTTPTAPVSALNDGKGQAQQPLGSGGEAAAEGDTSHCKDDKQSDAVFYAPPCVPKWPDGADNGGQTAAAFGRRNGVTKDKITVVYFREDKNEQVTTLLNIEDLRATRAEEVEFMEAAQDFINQEYETYGREVDIEIFDAAECPETPPDVAACIQEANRVIQELDPFIVVWPVPLYPEVFDHFASQGVITIGGWHFDERFYSQRRPYRWDVFMDGTRTADFVGEYYCNKLANKPATNAGRIIHNSFPNGGQRDLVPRKLGIFVPQSDAQKLPGYRLEQIVDACDENGAIVLEYNQDIDTGAIQASGNTQKLIEEHITTVVCICDPITPIFRTKDNDQSNYYPEHLLSGAGLLDHDKLGRLYQSQSQWIHAFGPSHLAKQLELQRSEPVRAWNAVRESQHPCPIPCGLHWAYYNMAGWMIQSAGPTVNAATVERGMLNLPEMGGWENTGGDPHYSLYQFGQADYTGVSDIREVYWDPNAPSSLDGKPGSYVAMDGGRRYRLGALPTKFEVPPAAR